MKAIADLSELFNILNANRFTLLNSFFSNVIYIYIYIQLLYTIGCISKSK